MMIMMMPICDNYDDNDDKHIDLDLWTQSWLVCVESASG